MARRTYTDQQRAEAIAAYLEHGAAEAGRHTGIPAGTIKAWASRADVATERQHHHVDKIEARRLAWDERRVNLAHRIGEVAEKALQRVEQGLNGDDQLEVRKVTRAGKVIEVIPDSSDVRNLATTMAILVDKAQLLTGGATSRSEHATAASVSAKLADVVDIGTKRAA